MLRVKRIYDASAPSDGYRILVDRLWPRGLRKETAALDAWLKEIAPSPQLRVWFDHRADRFEEFRARYITELEQNSAVATALEIIKQQKDVTLLYAAKDPAINHAVILRDYLRQQS